MHCWLLLLLLLLMCTFVLLLSEEIHVLLCGFTHKTHTKPRSKNPYDYDYHRTKPSDRSNSPVFSLDIAMLASIPLFLSLSVSSAECIQHTLYTHFIEIECTVPLRSAAHSVGSVAYPSAEFSLRGFRRGIFAFTTNVCSVYSAAAVFSDVDVYLLTPHFHISTQSLI